MPHRARPNALFRSLLQAAASAAVICTATPAWADAHPAIHVWGEAGFDDPGFGHPLTYRAAAEASYPAAQLRGSAFAREGLDIGDPWLASVEPSNQLYYTCGPSIPWANCNPARTGSAFSVDASTGTLRGYALAKDFIHQGSFELGRPYAGTGGSLGDRLHILVGDGITFRVSLDSRHHVDANNEPQVALPSTSFSYGIVVWTDPPPNCSPEDAGCDGFLASLSYNASRDGFGPAHQGFSADGTFQVVNQNLFGSLGDANAFIDLYLPNPNQPFYLSVSGAVFASCETRNDPNLGVGNDCRAWVGADHSAYLQILGHVSSANGFQYVGAVPEPQAAALWLAGLAALGFVARRRRGG